MSAVRSTLLTAGLSLALLAAPLTWVAEAHAQDSSKAVAEALFQSGRDLLDQGKTEEACTRLAQSQALEAKLGTLLNLAVCHEKLGKVASAWAEFTEAAEMARRAGEAKREAFARERTQALSQRLSMATLRADHGKLTGLSVDGSTLDIALLGTPLPLDPGKHTLAARGAGKKPYSADFQVPPGPARIELQIPALLDADPVALPPVPVPAPPAVPASAQVPVRAPDPADVTASPGPRRRAPGDDGVPALAWAGFTVAAAGVLVGAVTGGLSMSQTSGLKDCNKKTGDCPAGDAGTIATANTLANVSNVSFALAAVGLALGCVPLALAKSSGSGSSSSTMTITLSPGPLGGSLSGRF